MIRGKGLLTTTCSIYLCSVPSILRRAEQERFFFKSDTCCPAHIQNHTLCEHRLTSPRPNSHIIASRRLHHTHSLWR